MPSRRITAIARQDIVEITDRIAADNIQAAVRVEDAIMDAFRLLSENPNAGAMCQFTGVDRPDLRFWPIKKYRNYVVIYYPFEDGVEIVRVIHAARDMTRLVKRL